MLKGSKHSEETKKKIGMANSIASKGKKRPDLSLRNKSLEMRKRVSENKKGNKNMLGKHHSEDAKRRIAESNRGKKRSEETIRNIILSRKGKPTWASTHRKEFGELHKGEKCHFWKGGICPINAKIRSCFESKLWRESVLERDNFICQKTGIRGGNLVVHHINNFADFPELRFVIDNGITLLRESHREFHRKYGIKNNTKEQLEEFLNRSSLVVGGLN